MVIHKYTLTERDNKLRMPRNAQLLHLCEQQGFIRVWALIDPTEPVVIRMLSRVETGAEIRPFGEQSLVSFARRHVGTCLLENGAYVAHVFDMGEVWPGVQ